MLNRSDFEVLADIVRGVRIGDGGDITAARLADWLAGKNPRFNRAKWLEATRIRIGAQGGTLVSFALSLPASASMLNKDQHFALIEALMGHGGAHEVTADGFVEFLVDSHEYAGAITRARLRVDEIVGAALDKAGV